MTNPTKVFIGICKELENIDDVNKYSEHLKFIHRILDLDWKPYNDWDADTILSAWECRCQKPENEKRKSL